MHVKILHDKFQGYFTVTAFQRCFLKYCSWHRGHANIPNINDFRIVKVCILKCCTERYVQLLISYRFLVAHTDCAKWLYEVIWKEIRHDI